MSARGILGRSWGEIPLSLRIFAVVSVLELPWLVVLSWEHPGLVVVVAAVALGGGPFILRGSRVVWVFFVGFEVLTLALAPWTGSGSWWSVLLGLGETALLLLPSSLRFVWRPPPKRPPAPTGRTTWHAEAHTDPERPDGWYVDRANPSWMRYWRSETGEWAGSTAVPRKVAREVKRSEATPDRRTGACDIDPARGWSIAPARDG